MLCCANWLDKQHSLLKNCTCSENQVSQIPHLVFTEFAVTARWTRKQIWTSLAYCLAAGNIQVFVVNVDVLWMWNLWKQIQQNIGSIRAHANYKTSATAAG